MLLMNCRYIGDIFTSSAQDLLMTWFVVGRPQDTGCGLVIHGLNTEIDPRYASIHWSDY